MKPISFARTAPSRLAHDAVVAECARLRAVFAAEKARVDCGSGLDEACRNTDLVCLTCALTDTKADLAAERERARAMQVERDAANKRASEMHRRTQAAEAMVAQANEERDAAVRFRESVADIGVRMGMAVAGRTEGGGATPYGIVRELEVALVAERERAGQLRERNELVEPFYAALHGGHNGYREWSMTAAPQTPAIALAELLEEAEQVGVGIGRAECKLLNNRIRKALERIATEDFDGFKEFARLALLDAAGGGETR